MEVGNKDRKMRIQYVIRVTYFWYARRIMEVCHKDKKMTGKWERRTFGTPGG